MAAVTICSDFGAQENSLHCFHCFPIYLPWSDGTGCYDFSFLMLSFKPTFSLTSFTFIKKLFSSSSLSAIRVVSSSYLLLLTFLPAVFISACTSSSPGFCMMYSAYKLKSKVAIKSLDVRLSYLEPVNCSMSSSNCCFLTCIHISQEAGKVVWYSSLIKNFPVLLWCTQSKALA